MALLLGPAPVGIRQLLNNAKPFDGTAPITTATQSGALMTYAVGDAGGLFDFGQTSPIAIVSVELSLGGQSAWNVYIAETGLADMLLSNGTNETAKFLSPLVVLFPGQKIKVTTTGNVTTSGAATVKIQKCVTEQGIFIR